MRQERKSHWQQDSFASAALGSGQFCVCRFGWSLLWQQDIIESATLGGVFSGNRILPNLPHWVESFLATGHYCICHIGWSLLWQQDIIESATLGGVFSGNRTVLYLPHWVDSTVATGQFCICRLGLTAGFSLATGEIVLKNSLPLPNPYHSPDISCTVVWALRTSYPSTKRLPMRQIRGTAHVRS